MTTATVTRGWPASPACAESLVLWVEFLPEAEFCGCHHYDWVGMTKQEARPIIVGVDGSTFSLAALDWAARQGSLAREPLLAIMTWEWPYDLGWAPPPPGDYDPLVEATHVLDDAVGGARAAHPEVEIDTYVTESRPAPALVEASRSASLLVVGSRGHGGFAGMLLGSVSQHCVTNAHCPVVVVRDAD